jgi:hypothetical protein
VTYLYNIDDQYFIIDLVNNAIIANSYAKEVSTPLKSLD